ncbi:MAG: hypothetical protein AAGD07_24140 [Planctomycetota bacterium]
MPPAGHTTNMHPAGQVAKQQPRDAQKNAEWVKGLQNGWNSEDLAGVTVRNRRRRGALDYVTAQTEVQTPNAPHIRTVCESRSKSFYGVAPSR